MRSYALKTVAVVLFAGFLSACCLAKQSLPQISASWQLLDHSTGQFTNITGGTAVNNRAVGDPQACKLRVHTKNMPDNAWVYKIEIYADRFGVSDDLIDDIGTTDKEANRRISDNNDSDEINPPSDPSPISGFFGILSYKETHAYARVYIHYQADKNRPDVAYDREIKTAKITIPSMQIDDEQSSGGSDLDGKASAQVGVKAPGVSAGGSGTGGFKRANSWHGHTAFSDPDYTHEIVSQDPLPRGWRIGLTPNKYVLKPGETAETEVEYEAPTVGMYLYRIKTMCKTPKYNLTTLTEPLLLVVDDLKAPEMTYFTFKQAKKIHKVLYHMVGGGTMDPVTALNPRMAIGFHTQVEANTGGEMRVVLPRDLVAGRMPVVTIGNRRAASKQVAANEAYWMISVVVPRGKSMVAFMP